MKPEVKEYSLPEETLYRLYADLSYYLHERYARFTLPEIRAIRRVMAEIAAEYMAAQGKPITNSRHANSGRKAAYLDDFNAEIRRLYTKEHLSMRAIADKCGCSLSHVQRTITGKTRERPLKLEATEQFFDHIESVMKKWEE